jgi:alpha-1,2-mannosyltransferase
VFLSALVVMVLASPLTYVHHVAYVFPALVWLLLDLARRNRATYAVALVLFAAAAGIDFPLIGMRTGSTSYAVINFVSLLALYGIGLSQALVPPRRRR